MKKEIYRGQHVIFKVSKRLDVSFGFFTAKRVLLARVAPNIYPEQQGARMAINTKRARSYRQLSLMIEERGSAQEERHCLCYDRQNNRIFYWTKACHLLKVKMRVRVMW